MPAIIAIDNLHRCENGTTLTFSNGIQNGGSNDVTSNGTGNNFLETSHIWLNGILNNDIDALTNIIENCSEGDRNRLINGMFRFQEDIQSYLVQGINLKPFAVCPLTRPWCIAAVVGSHKVMDLLIRNGVDVKQYDENRNNVYHSLIYIAFLKPEMEEKLTNTFLHIKRVISPEKTNDLLLSENSFGFRPLELAAQLGAFSLFMAIFETEGLYITRREPHGVYTIEWFDVTDYETAGPNYRSDRSPLLSLMLLNGNKLTDPITGSLFKREIIRSWIATKVRSNTPFLITWFLMRMFFLVIFVLYDLSGTWIRPRRRGEDQEQFMNLSENNNTTRCSSDKLIDIPDWLNDVFSGYLLVHSLLSLIFYSVWIFVYIYKRFRADMYLLPTGYKRPLISRDFYIFCQYLLYLGIMCGILVSYFRQYFYFPPVFISLVYIETWVGLIWSVLFFMQMLPWIGHFVITVERMVTDLLKFILVGCIFLAAFSVAFARLISPDKDGKCPDEYSNFIETIYSTLITMLNMVDYRTFDVNDPVGLIALHVVYVFMVAIMLINFLIALFSNSVSQVYNNRRVMETVQRLSVSFMCEDFLVKLCPGLKMAVTRRYFSRERDRIYLNRVVIHRSVNNH